MKTNRVTTLLLLMTCALAACSQNTPTGSPNTGTANAPASPSPAHDPSTSIPWFQGTTTAAFAAARTQNKPIFLFWHASWCPYCQDLKSTVFPRPDFLAKLTFFIPVSLDGDAPGAQKTADEFHVSGYPTVLILSPDRKELARISGGMDLNRYAEVLDVVLGDVKPVKELLASLDHSDAALTATDCRRLAYNAWSLDPENTSGPEELRGISASLAKAADKCPPASTVERARLTILAAATATDADDEDFKAGKPPAQRTVALVGSVYNLLADVPLATSVVDSLQELSENFFLAAKRSSPETAQNLLQRWIAVMTAAATDTRYSDGQRLAAVAMELNAAKALEPNGAIPAPLATSAKARLQETLSHKHDSYTRAAVINAAIEILETLDEPQQAYTLTEAELNTATTPYYYMLHLASIDEKLGRTDAALGWMKRAYQESKGPATRFRWGTSFVTGMIRMRPADAPAIREATLSVLGEIDGPDALSGGTASRLHRLENALKKWNAGGAHADVIAAAKARMNGICSKTSDATQANEACKGFLTS